MTTHEQVAQDLPLYALGTLADDERRSVEEHLHECARCRFELHLLREDMNRLSLSGPEIPHEVHHSRDLPPMITLDEARPAAPSHYIYWIAAIPVVLCMVLGAMVVQLRTQNMELNTQSATQQGDLIRERTLTEHARLVDSVLRDQSSVHFASTSGAAQVQVVYNANQHRAIVLGTNLPHPLSSQVYQLWLIPANGGRPVSGSTFLPDAAANVFHLSQALPRDLQVAGFEITSEISGGALAPTSQPVFSAKQ